MNLEQFITKYKGKTLGYPEGQYVGECLSLVKVYIKEMFGIEPPPSGCNAARCYWSKFPSPLGTRFTKIPKTDDFTPQAGDIMVWNENVGGGAGHIAICTGNNTGLRYFESLDQNWGGREAHLVNHTYANVYGVLRPKGVMNDNQELDKLRKQVTDLTQEVEYKNEQIGNYDEQVKGLNIELEEEKAARKRDLQTIAEKLACSDDLVEVLKEIEKLIVAEEGLRDCLTDKRECEQNSAQKATELAETYENIKLLSGYPIASSRGVEKAMRAYLKLHQTEVVGDISDYQNIIKLAGVILWQK